MQTVLHGSGDPARRGELGNTEAPRECQADGSHEFRGHERRLDAGDAGVRGAALEGSWGGRRRWGLTRRQPVEGRSVTERQQMQISDKDFRRCEVLSGSPSAWREWRRKFRTAMKAVAHNVDEALGRVERQGEQPDAEGVELATSEVGIDYEQFGAEV